MKITPSVLIKDSEQFYDEICWFPKVDKILLNKFGNDIGNIIMNYVKAFKSENDEV